MRARLLAAKRTLRNRKRLARYTDFKRKKAYQIGYQEGLDAAKRAIAEEMLLLESERHTLVEKAKHQCLEVALQIAQEILQEKIKISKTFLEKKIGQITDQILDKRKIVIHVHPKDLKRLQKSDYFVVCGDPLIASGDAVIKTSHGEVIYRWEDEFRKLAETIANHSD